MLVQSDSKTARKIKGNGHGSEQLDQEREVHLHAHSCFLFCLYKKKDSLYFL